MPSRLALIGYGTGGRVFHAPLIQATDGLELTFVVTSREAPATVLAHVDELWARADEVDAVVISTPTDTHVALAQQAVRLGLPVVLDKPLAASSAAGGALIEEAAALGVPLTVFQNRRWDGDYLTFRMLDLGRVHRFESRFDRWRPVPGPGWKESVGGGVVVDLGAHLVDQAVLAFGPVSSVYAEIAARRPGAVAPDDGFIALTHTSGTVSHLWMSYLAAGRGPRLRVLGDRGTFTVWGMDPQEEALAAGVSPRVSGWGASNRRAEMSDGTVDRPVLLVPGDYRAFYAQLARALAGDGPLPCDPRASLEVVRLLELAARSAATGQVVQA